VFDKYGSRECTDMACECWHHNGLHVFSPSCFLEVVDDDLATCSPGRTGRILVTLLNNRAFPMIRYDIGDVGSWAQPEPCPCGSPFPRLQAVEGRQDEMLTTQDGTLQSSVFVRHFVGVSLNRQLIREWQLEQTDRLNFVFRYVPLAREGLAENLAELEAVFQKVLGESITVDMREVEEIPPTKSGKIRWVVNSYRPPSAGSPSSR
jgi:phenylacetate-CoA ligase